MEKKSLPRKEEALVDKVDKASHEKQLSILY